MGTILQTTLPIWFDFDSYFIEIFPKDIIYNISAMVQIMAWGRTCDKPLSDSVMTQVTGVYICHLTLMS